MDKLRKGWKIKTLGEICKNQLQTGPFGSQLHSNEYVDDGVAVLMPKDLINFKVNASSAAKITQEKAKELGKHILKNGDILFSRRGDVARFAMIDKLSEGTICGTGCLRARPSDNFSAEYLFYVLQQDNVRLWLEQNAVGQTMPNMNTSILSELPLKVILSKEEQIKIAEILSAWDNAIQTTEKQITNSQQQKKALMQMLLSGEKRVGGFSGEWGKAKLGNVAKMSSGGTPKSTIKEYYNGDIKWVSIADMTKQGKYILETEKTLSQLGLENSSAKLFPENTILYAMYASIGECSIAKVPVTSSQAILGIQPNEALYFEYLYFYLCSLKDRIKLQGQQGTQANLNAGMVKDFDILLPSIDEQQKIAEILTIADQEIETLQRKLECLKLEKRGLMQGLL